MGLIKCICWYILYLSYPGLFTTGMNFGWGLDARYAGEEVNGKKRAIQYWKNGLRNHIDGEFWVHKSYVDSLPHASKEF